MKKTVKIYLFALTFGVFTFLFGGNSASAQNVNAGNNSGEAKDQISSWEYEYKQATCLGLPEWQANQRKNKAIKELRHWIPIYRDELYAARMQARKDKNVDKVKSCNRELSSLDEIEDQIDGVETIYPIVENGKYGYIDRTGKVVIEPQFRYISGILGGTASAMKGDKWYLIISKDIIVEVSEQTRLVNGMALVSVNGKYGYIDKKGKMAIEPQFEMANEFSGGAAAVEVNRMWGYIKKNGEFAIEPQFDNAGGFHEGLASVQKNGKCGYIDTKGDMVIEIKPRPFSYYKDFSNGLAEVCSNGKWGYINRQGELVIRYQFDETYPFSEGLALVGGFDNLEYYGDDDNPYASEHLSTYGFIDKTGKVVIAPVFDYADSFGDGVAAVKKNNEWYFIDQAGNEIFNQKFDSCGSFKRGLAYVKIGGKMAYINRNGEIVWKEK